MARCGTTHFDAPVFRSEISSKRYGRDAAAVADNVWKKKEGQLELCDSDMQKL